MNETLHGAANKLRASVAALPIAIQADWRQDGSEIYTDNPPDPEWVGETLRDDGGGDEIAAFMTLMQPGVALRLSALLEDLAKLRRPSRAALMLANAILGEDS